MKTLIAIIALAALAAGCGQTTGAGTTVTRTETVQVAQTPDECRTMGLQLLESERLLISAAQGYVSLFEPIYTAGLMGTPIGSVTAKMQRQTAKVQQATAALPDSATVSQCFG